MKKLLIASVAISLAVTGAILANCGSCGSDAKKPQHRFIACCFSKGMIMIVGKDGKVEREIKGTGHVQDAWMLKNGNILYSHYGGAREIDKDNKVVWEYKIKGCEVHSAQPLANGNVLVGESGNGRIVEVDRSGKVVVEIKVETKVTGKHHQFRMCRKTAKGTYLVACFGDGVIKELDGDGKVLRTLSPAGQPKKNNAHAAVPMPNGHVLASTGYGKSFVEFDANGKIIWTLSGADLPKDFKLAYTCSIQQLPNGNRVIATYHGHPQFFEVTPQKKVVWSYENKDFGNVSGILILDDKADPVSGKIIR
jgi:hypothetical protein